MRKKSVWLLKFKPTLNLLVTHRKEFSSINSCAKETGISEGTIRSAIKSKGLYLGFNKTENMIYVIKENESRVTIKKTKT